jgi:dTDP-4-amino-4,6-dideoxy-D-galactose acyltransferase
LLGIVGESFTQSRFYADPHFGAEKALRLYEEWIKRCFSPNSTPVILALHEKEGIGFVTCELDTATHGRLGLVAVARQARERGCGSALIKAAIGHFRHSGIRSVTVATQGSNVSAQRLYQKCGFRIREVNLWFHLWADNLS